MRVSDSQLPACVSLTFLMIGMISGCSSSQFETIPVSGQITMTGQVLPKDCYLYFVPTAPGEGMPSRPSVATMADDGSYSVSAFKDSDGLLPGTYSVIVAYYVLKPGGNPNSDSAWVERRYQAGELVVAADSDDVEFNIEVPAQAKS
ncbi:MAG: hypothetical protein H0T51_02095 [Pirellulales bacterium]|nr:hypothetical protein [Pirellulales bacterium]